MMEDSCLTTDKLNVDGMWKETMMYHFFSND